MTELEKKLIEIIEQHLDEIVFLSLKILGHEGKLSAAGLQALYQLNHEMSVDSIREHCGKTVEFIEKLKGEKK